MKACRQCNKLVLVADPNVEAIVFCDDVCLNSYTIEKTSESKAELLEAMAYADNRAELEEEF